LHKITSIINVIPKINNNLLGILKLGLLNNSVIKDKGNPINAQIMGNLNR
jgi:hypothetical protein